MSSGYFASKKRKKITKDAMDQMRKTRSQIDPDLLTRVRQIIQGDVDSAPRWAEPITVQKDMVPVDKKKILDVAVKFLEMNPKNTALQREITAYISEDNPQ